MLLPVSRRARAAPAPTSYVDNLRDCIANSGENPVPLILQHEEETHNTTISTDHMAKAILRTEDPRFGRSPGEHVVRALGKSLGLLIAVHWRPVSSCTTRSCTTGKRKVESSCTGRMFTYGEQRRTTPPRAYGKTDTGA